MGASEPLDAGHDIGFNCGDIRRRRRILQFVMPELTALDTANHDPRAFIRIFQSEQIFAAMCRVVS
ncbi:hypothetical protein CF64_05170 [Bradyrhizobium japonicum]|nr:hypothetical protein CF64_05170 [Bradyrhizobium japonicum]